MPGPELADVGGPSEAPFGASGGALPAEPEEEEERPAETLLPGVFPILGGGESVVFGVAPCVGVQGIYLDFSWHKWDLPDAAHFCLWICIVSRQCERGICASTSPTNPGQHCFVYYSFVSQGFFRQSASRASLRFRSQKAHHRFPKIMSFFIRPILFLPKFSPRRNLKCLSGFFWECVTPPNTKPP